MNRILNRQKFHEEFVYQTIEIKQNRLTTRWANEQPLSFSLSPSLHSSPQSIEHAGYKFSYRVIPRTVPIFVYKFSTSVERGSRLFFFCFFPQTWRFEWVEKKGKIKERERERDSATPDVEQVRKVRVSDCRMQLLPFSRACHGN